jgi:hypothetical protein
VHGRACLVGSDGCGGSSIWAALVAELHAQIQIECDRLNTLSLLIFCLNDKFVSEHFSVAARRVSEYVELTSLLSPTFSALY